MLVKFVMRNHSYPIFKLPLSWPYFFWQTTTFPNCPSPIVTLRVNFSQICDVPFVTGTTWAFSEFISIGITMISVCLDRLKALGQFLSSKNYFSMLKLIFAFSSLKTCKNEKLVFYWERNFSWASRGYQNRFGLNFGQN